VTEKCKYYLNHWSETRFFRHHHDLTWTSGYFPPKILEWQPYPIRIWVKNYSYRSPDQIDKRLATRRPAIAAGQFAHEAVPNWASYIDPEMIAKFPQRGLDKWDPKYSGQGWRERVVDASKLDYDAGDRKLVTREDLMPPVPYRNLRWLRARLGRSETIRRVVRSYRARSR
jgi:hypothetical protein